MSSQSGIELQELMSHIMNGKSHLEQLRRALEVPLLKRWNLKTYHDIPKASQGCTLFAWAIQNKNTTALGLLMKNLGLASLPEEPSVDIRLQEKSNLLCIAVEYYHEPTWNFVLQNIDIERVFEKLGKGNTTVLHVAAKRNVADIFRALRTKLGSALEDKLLKIRDGTGQTVLHVAASRNPYNEEAEQRCYNTVVELLTIQPKLIKAQDNNRETVFHKAVVANQKNVLQRLLSTDAAILSRCDRNGDSAYILFRRKRGNIDHIQAESQKDVESFKELSRTLSFNEEIGSMLHKAILGLHEDISTKRQLLFKDEPGGVGPELKWDLSKTFEGQKLNFTEYLRDLESKKFNANFYETLIKVVLPDLGCTENRACDATNYGLRKSPEANVVFKHLRSKGVEHIIEAVVPDCMVHPHANRHIINALRPFNIKRLEWRKLDLGVKTIALAAPEVEVLTLYSGGDRDALSQWVNIDGLCQLPKVLHTIHITIFRDQDDDTELENTRRQCEEALLNHKKHSQHDPALRIVSDNGSWKTEPLPCDCQEPRFPRSQITVKLGPVPVASHEPNGRLPPDQYRLQGTIFDKLSEFWKFLMGLDGPEARSRADIDYLRKNPVKVAVLDSGIYADSSQFPALEGASFIEHMSSADSHWHTTTNSHGTIMASLIRKLDPNCRILAARTHHGPDMQGGDIDATIKALEWAVRIKADIICISWTCAGDVSDDHVGRLETKIQEAANNSLIFCATGDKGPSAEGSYPAGFKNPFKICSCSINGKPSHNAESHNAEFYLPAEGLDVALPKYLNQGEKGAADGSSAATAIAVGLATLTLSLARFAYYRLEDDYSEPPVNDSDNDDYRSDYSGHGRFRSRALLPQVERAEEQVAKLKARSMMERIFKHMCCSSDKFVQPWEVFPMDLVGMDHDKAKTCVADFLDRAIRNKF